MRVFPRILLALSLVACIGGCILTGWGWSEWRLGKKSSAAPSAVELADVEEGQRPGNNHLRIGPHYACYYSSVYSYKERKHASKGDPDPSIRPTYTYYPIVSTSNEDAQLLEELKKKHGADLGSLPDDEDLPSPEHFAVLVKTTRFKSINEVHKLDLIRREQAVQGLVINEVSSLSTEEKNLIREEFPDIDFGKVLIVEEGRSPSSTGTAMAAMVGGGTVIVLGIVGFLTAVILFVIGLLRG